MDKNMVDCILEEIKEESEGYAKYMELSRNAWTSEIANKFKSIAEDEKHHHEMLIDILGSLAKQSDVGLHTKEVR